MVVIVQERLQLEEKMRKQEMELDYLAPFLAQIGNPEKLTRQQAYKLKEDCLADLKQRLIDKANLIQARFEKVNQTCLRISGYSLIHGPIETVSSCSYS